MEVQKFGKIFVQHICHQKSKKKFWAISDGRKLLEVKRTFSHRVSPFLPPLLETNIMTNL